ncbi:hypothetical protein CANMA_002577 [Candida margitis]|uniref:uncharacterized protein n=1 Tax=Candida margitis TaxID=1775924 RepID=UPI0022275C27|nr:uncharacterized protein CANMA_002577 [Candida margitis]KAI5968075.1 hypothetical protein CANMA_002577 [Candida margitis]
MSLKYALRQAQRGLIFNTPQVSIESTIEQVTQLPNFKSRLRALYKRFYKLRKFECTPILFRVDDNPYVTPDITSEDYVALVKRNFKYVDYNIKRQKLLGKLPPLSEDQLEQRLFATLAFVFNHTVATANPHAEELITTNIVEKKSSIDTIESQVISTLLRMDHDCPWQIKYDYKFQWLDQQEGGNRPKKKKRNDNEKLPYLTYKQYLTTLMRLNESLGLCL